MFTGACWYRNSCSTFAWDGGGLVGRKLVHQCLLYHSSLVLPCAVFFVLNTCTEEWHFCQTRTVQTTSTAPCHLSTFYFYSYISYLHLPRSHFRNAPPSCARYSTDSQTACGICAEKKGGKSPDSCCLHGSISSDSCEVVPAERKQFQINLLVRSKW